jgi:hypothetical protein
MGRKPLVRAGRLLGLMAATASMVLLGTAPASAAAAPENDTIAGAKAIAGVPFSETIDTTEATTDAEDAAVNSGCGAPATNGSVWYTLTASEPAYAIDVSQSDFTAGAIVATGTPGNLTLVDCGPRSIGFEATAGQTYYIMAFSDNPDVVGGQLAIAVTATSPAPRVSLTVDDVGRANKSGTATISGTYTCIGNADLTILQGRLSQQQGDVHVVGDFDQSGQPCGGTFKWIAEITPQSGKFERGQAATIALTAGCNVIGCNSYEALEVVRLRGGGH